LKVWQLQQAKAQFSEVFDLALTQGPQKVTRRGKDAVVILPERAYRSLVHQEHYVDRYRRFSGNGADLDLIRSEEGPREVKL
jgi:antitoxin Phd